MRIIYEVTVWTNPTAQRTAGWQTTVCNVPVKIQFDSSDGKTKGDQDWMDAAARKVQALKLKPLLSHLVLVEVIRQLRSYTNRRTLPD